jgi:type VI protein secretion system component Hcp
MRPIMNITMCALVAAALAAPALATTPAYAASADYYLKLGDIKPVLSKVEGGEAALRSGAGKHIEILSWSWGATNAGKYGAVAGAHRDDTVDPAEKRQHGWMPVTQPLDRGAVRVKVKFPWLDCKVGAAFPDAVLQNDAGRYEFKEVMITSCATAPSATGGAAPADEISFNYAKVIVRGWDPAKKEE